MTFDKYIRDKMVAIGVTPAGFEKWWRVQPVNDVHGPSGRKAVPKTPAHIGESIVKGHLNPGVQLDIMQTEVLKRIDRHLACSTFSTGGADTCALARDDGSTSLLGWCSEVLIDSVTRAFFGDELMQIEPEMGPLFVKFDDLNWQFILQYPEFLSREMTSARNKMIEALTTYFERPLDTRSNASSFVLSLEKEMRMQGIGSGDIASMMMLTIWALNSNTYKLCFWTMAYILQDGGLLDVLRHETRTVADQEPLEQVRALDNCPRLDAVYHEVLRLTTASTSIRTVISPTVIGGKEFSVGNDVFMPFRQMHLDPAVFGTDSRQFNPARFLDNTLKKSPSYRPFGGGTTYCPGRFLAKREVLTFVALALNRFDLAVTGSGQQGSQFPRLETRKPSLGVLAPIAGDDITIYVRPKQEKKT
ncbi:MAG: hypothetical protein Q9216_005557 [Gyalolechia sp. 2 TL-2023]